MSYRGRGSYGEDCGVIVVKSVDRLFKFLISTSLSIGALDVGTIPAARWDLQQDLKPSLQSINRNVGGVSALG